MAISIESFTQDRPYPGDFVPGNDLEFLASDEVATEEEIRELLRDAIEYFAQEAKKKVHLVKRSKIGFTLFSIEGDQNEGTASAWKKIERGKLQEIAFQVMSDYGFDAKVYEEDPPFAFDNGLIREHRTYPSTTINGLVFERWAYRVDGTDTYSSADWRILDQSPFGIRLR